MTDIYNQCERCGAPLNSPTARFCSRRCQKGTTHVLESAEKRRERRTHCFGLRRTVCGKAVEGTTDADHRTQVVPLFFIVSDHPTCDVCQKAANAVGKGS